MADQADPKIADSKADAAAEKAYAAAAETVSPRKADEPAKAEPKPEPAKIDAAVAEVKAAPKAARKAPVRKAKPAVASKTPVKKAAAKKVTAPKKSAAKNAAAPKQTVAKAKPAAKPAAPKASTPIKTTPTTVSKLKEKIMATAKTTDFTATVKTAAADAQTRAKAAYDKLQAYAGEMTEFTKGNVEALVESGKILGAGVQDIARGEVEAAKGAFETATADFKALAAVKSPTELFKLQGEIARRNFDAAVARASKNAEVATKLAGDAFAPISSRMSLAAEKFSKAA